MIAVARQLVASFRFLVMMTVLLGVAYPGVITLAAQALPTQANGSLLSDSQGRVVGSALMGQAFEGPQWFQARPSASDYAGAVSGGSNLSPTPMLSALHVPTARPYSATRILLQTLRYPRTP